MSKKPVVTLSAKEEVILMAIASQGRVYGKEIIDFIEKAGGGYKTVVDGTLYPNLTSLCEEKKLIKSSWGSEKKAGARRKYFTLTKKGEQVINDLSKVYSKLLGLGVDAEDVK